MKNLPLFKPVILLFALLPLLCHAQIYTWKDENGTIHYGDAKNKPGNVKADKVSLKINTYEGVEVDSIATSTQKVEMFSTSWCGYCKKARRYFQKNGIAFVEYDIEKDKAAARRHKKLGGTGVPLILFGKKRMKGFSESRFERMYQQNTEQAEKD